MAETQRVKFSEDIEIDVNALRLEHSHNYAKAYSAGSPDSGMKGYIAVVCENGAQPRTRYIAPYANVGGEYLPRLVNAGAIRWPSDNSHRMVFLYEDKLGKPITDTEHGLALGWKAEKVLDRVVRPLLFAIKAMRDVDMAHGAIRATRLFDGGVTDFENVMLGECLSAPTSATQPALYEPIARALASPLGRGPCGTSDDLYALGVTACVLLRPRDPLRNPSDADLIRAKQELGTFYSLMGDQRVIGPLLEFLRGVLADEERERWTIDDALAWLDGRRATPRQITKKKPAQRAFEFVGSKYTLPQTLATEMIRRPSEAVAVAESPELNVWLTRAYGDQESIDRLAQAMSMTRDPMNRAGGSEKVAAYAAVALDPSAPIRYKDLAFLPEGLGQLLCDAYAKGLSVQNYVEVLQSTLQTYWLSVHGDAPVDIASMSQKFEQCRSLMRNAHNPGFGLERVVYFLNQDAPCLSPMFKNAYVRTPEDVVIALNDACKISPKPARLVDRHIIAFLAERDRKAIEMHIFDINSGKPSQVYLGTLRCLAALQKRSRMDVLPELTLWMADLAKPVYATFHDRDLREEVQRRVEKVKDEGRLWRILEVLTDPQIMARDMALFSSAYREYQALTHERDMLEMRLQSPQNFGKRAGMEAASMTAAAVGFFVGVGLLLVYLQNGNMPWMGQ